MAQEAGGASFSLPTTSLPPLEYPGTGAASTGGVKIRVEESCASIKLVGCTKWFLLKPSNRTAKSCSLYPSRKCQVQFMSQLCQVQSIVVSPLHFSQAWGLVESPKKLPTYHSELERPATSRGLSPG